MNGAIERIGAMLGVASLGAVLTLAVCATAGEVTAVIRKGDQMLVERAGQTQPMTEDVMLPGEIAVSTNGTFRVAGGKPRPLRDGDRLEADGMLTSADGRTAPVFDHLTRQGTQVLLVRDGQAAPLSQPFVLSNGIRVLPDGTLQLPSGRVRRLLDGQLLALSGAVIAAQDTVTLRQGVVWVQKDGAQFSVARGRSLMMNDGTKVFGDGNVVRPDGQKLKLVEGQILKLPGVTNAP